MLLPLSRPLLRAARLPARVTHSHCGRTSYHTLCASTKPTDNTLRIPSPCWCPTLTGANRSVGSGISCAGVSNDAIIDAGKVYIPQKGSGKKDGTLYGRPSVRD
jgi:hypothetical protein